MNFEEIMREITKGLTGNSEEDTRYLQEQMEKYKDHEMNQEILRACGRLLYKCLPEEKKEQFVKAFRNDSIGHETILEEVRFKQHEKKYDEALALMEGLIQKIEKLGMFTDDQVSEYHCFNEFFEEALYRQHAKPTKDLRNPSIPLDVIYMQYGSVLIDLRRLEDAKQALATAMHWNPSDAGIAFEYAETFKLLGDMDSFFHLTISIFPYAFRPEQVARCYRNLGFYFTEKALWEPAVACFTMSLQYDPQSHMAMSELYYIQQKAGRTIPKPSIETIREIGKEYGFPIGVDKDILGMSYAYGKHFAEQGNIEAARYCWEITYALTDDEEIKEMLNRLPKNVQ